MGTRRTIEMWVERFNAGDVRDGLIVHQRGYWDSAQLNEIHPDVHAD